MKIVTLIFTSISILFCFGAFGQCSTMPPTTTEMFKHDTTFEVQWADTTTGTAGYTYHWVFSDGSTFSGPVAKMPHTVNLSSNSYTLTVTDPSSCVSSYTGSEVAYFVFNCNTLLPYYWDFVNPYSQEWFQQTNLTDPNSVVLIPGDNYDFVSSYGYNNHNLSAHVSVDWGNGHTVSVAWPTDTLFKIGGPLDPAHASQYIYGGEYKIGGTYFYSYDTMTCPVMPMSPVTIHVAGPTAHPVFSGATSYCVGDTIRLTAVDTTLFHNIYHKVDTPGLGGNGFYLFGYGSSFGSGNQTDRSSFTFEWYDPNMNLLSSDTSFTLNNVTLLDSGVYTLHVREHISDLDTIFSIHITTDSGAHVSAITGMSIVCESAVTALSNATAGGVWTTSSANAAVVSGLVTGISAGVATISYTLTNGCGSATDTMLVTVNPLPAAGSISGPSAVCVAHNITLTGGALGASWTSTNSCATVGGGLVYGVFPGNTLIICSMTNGCGTDSDTMAVTVNILPNSGVITGADTICQGLSMLFTESVSSGYWISSDASVATISPSGVVTALGVGLTTVSYSVTNVCGTVASAHPVYVEDCASLAIDNEGASGNSVRIYPNPSGGSFNVVLAQPTANTVVTITDITGKVIAEIRPTGNVQSVPVLLQNEPSGTYLIRVESGEATYRDKIIIW